LNDDIDSFFLGIDFKGIKFTGTEAEEINSFLERGILFKKSYLFSIVAAADIDFWSCESM
jgi:hypothetical protein